MLRSAQSSVSVSIRYVKQSLDLLANQYRYSLVRNIIPTNMRCFTYINLSEITIVYHCRDNKNGFIFLSADLTASSFMDEEYYFW